DPPNVGKQHLAGRGSIVADAFGQCPGRVACPLRPWPASGVGNGEQRMPVVVRPVVEIVERYRLSLHELRGAVMCPPPRLLRYPRQVLASLSAEALDLLAQLFSPKLDDDRAIVDGCRRLADLCQQYRCPGRELSRLVTVADASNDASVPAMAAVDDAPQVLVAGKVGGRLVQQGRWPRDFDRAEQRRGHDVVSRKGLGDEPSNHIPQRRLAAA